MKKVILMFIVTLVTGIVLKSFSDKEAISSNLLLSNVEALASDESDRGYNCRGTGNITCPSTGEKVYYYTIFYNLE